MVKKDCSLESQQPVIPEESEASQQEHSDPKEETSPELNYGRYDDRSLGNELG